MKIFETTNSKILETINPIICNNNSVNLVFNKSDPMTFITNKTDFFQASSTSSSTPISDISIIKVFDETTSRVRTTIKAYGHNTGIIGRRVERGIQQINN